MIKCIRADLGRPFVDAISYIIKISIKTMEQPNHMIDMVIYLYVNFYPCKIRHQVKNL